MKHSKTLLERRREKLTAEWYQLKALERETTEQRRALEAEILTFDLEDKRKGNEIDLGPTVIRFGNEAIWDQSRLKQLKEQLPDNDFPFEVIHKPIQKALKKIQVEKPEVWFLLKDAYSTKPKRPYFAWVKSWKA